MRCSSGVFCVRGKLQWNIWDQSDRLDFFAAQSRQYRFFMAPRRSLQISFSPIFSCSYIFYAFKLLPQLKIGRSQPDNGGFISQIILKGLAPNFDWKLVGGCILVSGCPSVSVCVRSSHFFDACHILWTAHARVLKFHVWIPHGKIADQYFFLIQVTNVSPFLKLCPFEKKSEWNLVSKISREIFELGAWNLVSW